MKKIILRIILKLSRLNIIRISDKKYLSLMGELRLGKKINIDNPQTFNEKLQWLKLYDRNPDYTKMVDKYEVKKYVTNIIGEDYIIPTLGVYNDFDKIDFDELPNQFVIKCTHDSGGNVICRDKSKLDLKISREKIKKCLKKNYYNIGREWSYKNVKPRIIIEKYLDSKEEIIDYKFFCFNGEAKILLICSNRSKNLKETWFDVKWNKLELKEGNCETDNELKKPKNLNLMINLANKLSKDISFVRIDFYENNDKVYFGEITFFPKSGYEEFIPEKYDRIFGDMLKLPRKDIKRKFEKNEN